MKAKKFYWLASLFIMVSLVVGSTWMAQAAVQASPSTFNAVADAYVVQSSATHNYGTSTTLRVDASPNTISYLRFVVSGLNGNAIQSVKLRIYANSANSTGFSVRGVSNTTWSESGITYNNSPALGGVIANSPSFGAKAWVEVDVTGYVQTDGTYSLALTSTSSTNTSLASREVSGREPQLVVTSAAAVSATPTRTSVNPTATSVNTPSGTQTLTVVPSQDSYVNAGSPSSNYGTSTTLRVDASPLVNSYLRFSVSGLGGQVTQASLRIYANSASSQGLEAYAVSNNTWSETSITVNNAPAFGSRLDSVSTVASGAWVTFDVTSYISGNGDYNFGLSTPGSTAMSLASRESGAHAPQLVISFGGAATPVPSATRTSTPLPSATRTSTVVPASTATPTPTRTAIPQPTATSAGSDWQPSFPIRAAFYYPWFAEAWTQQGIYPYTNYTPQLGFYSSTDQSILKQHIAMMQYGNIQAAIASWWGQGSQTDGKIAGLLTAAAGTNFRWALYYENESQGNPSASQIQNDLTYILNHYGKDPGYLRVNGKFVVFVYADAGDACGMADRWNQGNTVGAYIVLKVFPGYASCASQPDSWHQYSPAVAADQQGNFSYSISPGFWLKGNAMRLARDLNRWSQNVADMAASGANWQLVTTFSEWGEGTSVEPAQEWSSSSGYGQYLDALHAVK